MADILIRDVDERVVEQMKRLAKAQKTSMQVLAKRTLEREFRPKMTTEEWLATVREHRKKYEGRDFPDLVELRRSQQDAWPE